MVVGVVGEVVDIVFDVFGVMVEIMSGSCSKVC